MAANAKLYLGLLSGTSMDGIDAAALRVGDTNVDLVAARSFPYDDALLRQLRNAISNPLETHVDVIGELDVRLGKAFAAAARELVAAEQLDMASVAAIGSHGQTIRHRPDAPVPFTIQLGDPNVIAAQTGATVVADFRRRDVALGGEGAPLLPPFHRVVFGSSSEDRVVVNIGGIANVTMLPKTGELTGFDTGPGNCLLDEWIEQHSSARYDHDGDWASSGKIDERLLATLRADGYFTRTPPKSTGREHFNLAWLTAHLVGLPDAPAPEDVQATILEFTARQIAAAVGQPDRVLVCGGGVHNSTLMRRLDALLPGTSVASTADHGLDPDWVEAAAFAWLAHRTLTGLPGNCPSVTGASEGAVLGGIYR